MRRRLLCDNNPSYIIAVYKPISTSKATQLLGTNFDISQVKSMYVDEVKLTSPVATYTFSDTNSHTVKIVMNENVTNLSSMFSGCIYLTLLDNSNLDTRKVTNMSEMFCYCYRLTSLDLSNFDTSNVADMDSMFAFCIGLNTLDLSNFDTSNVADMDSMFYNCSGLISLDLSNFDTSDVTNMSHMFAECYSLTNLTMMGDVSNVTELDSMFDIGTKTTIGTFHWNPDYYYFDIIDALPSTWKCDPSVITEVVTPTSTTNETRILGNTSSVQTVWVDNEKQSTVGTTYIFSDTNEHTIHIVMNSGFTLLDGTFVSCVNTTSIDLSHLDSSNVTEMAGTFDKCRSLTSIDLSPLDTSKVEIMESMFNGCSSLTSLDLSGFDTSNVIVMSEMFEGCDALEMLNLYGLDTTNVQGMTQMFQSCSNLKTVLMDGDMSNVTYAIKMFSGCTSLTSVVLFSANKIQPTSYSGIFEGITTAGTLYLNRSCAPPSFIGQIPTTWTYKALTSSPSPDYFS